MAKLFFINFFSSQEGSSDINGIQFSFFVCAIRGSIILRASLKVGESFNISLLYIKPFATSRALTTTISMFLKEYTHFSDIIFLSYIRYCCIDFIDSIDISLLIQFV